MKFTPKNLKKLPVGSYQIAGNFYIRSDYISYNTLHVSLFDGERRYKIGNGLDSFNIRIDSEEQESGITVQKFRAVVFVANHCFEMSDYHIYELRKYRIQLKGTGTFKEYISKLKINNP